MRDGKRFRKTYHVVKSLVCAMTVRAKEGIDITPQSPNDTSTASGRNETVQTDKSRYDVYLTYRNIHSRFQVLR